MSSNSKSQPHSLPIGWTKEMNTTVIASSSFSSSRGAGKQGLVLGPADKKSESVTNHRRKKNRPTILWGIFSVLGDVQQRKMIRETYLKFYQDLPSNMERDRICSLNEYISAYEEGGNNRFLIENCQIAYVFVVGGNPNGPTELMKPNATFPISIDGYVDEKEDCENDLVSLNIKENMEDGKSQTWFNYASLVNQHLDGSFDYILKADSDTLVFVPSFLKYLASSPSKKTSGSVNGSSIGDNSDVQIERVYGGFAHFNTSCNPNQQNHNHPCPLHLLGDMYMGGPLYFMSQDLAEFIVSDEVDRGQLQIGHEDVDIGNYVFSHPLPIKTIQVDPRHVLLARLINCRWERTTDKSMIFHTAYWAHSEDLGIWPGPFFKEERNFRKMWRQFQGYWNELGSKTKHPEKDIFRLHDLPSSSIGNNLIHMNDYIFSRQDFDSSPIVIESRKLIFFTITGIADTTWRCLFRRILNYKDWRDPSKQFEGLTYLSNYTTRKASEMISSPDYIKAMFVRDPKLRLIDTYEEHVRQTEGRFMLWSCCGGDQNCVDAILKDFSYFAKRKIPDCDEPYWRPQGRQMEPRFYRYLNFIGHYATIQKDSEQLLKRIGVWEKYAERGWGEDGNQNVFHDATMLDKSTFEKYYTTPELEKAVQKLNKMDYSNPVLNLTRKVRFETSG